VTAGARGRAGARGPGARATEAGAAAAGAERARVARLGPGAGRARAAGGPREPEASRRLGQAEASAGGPRRTAQREQAEVRGPSGVRPGRASGGLRTRGSSAWRGPGSPACGARSGARERAGAWRGSAEQSAGGGAGSGAGCLGASGRQRERAETGL
jgi:hypothetical protein